MPYDLYSLGAVLPWLTLIPPHVIFVVGFALRVCRGAARRLPTYASPLTTFAPIWCPAFLFAWGCGEESAAPQLFWWPDSISRVLLVFFFLESSVAFAAFPWVTVGGSYARWAVIASCLLVLISSLSFSWPAGVPDGLIDCAISWIAGCLGGNCTCNVASCCWIRAICSITCWTEGLSVGEVVASKFSSLV